MSPGTDDYAALEWLTARKITRFKSEINRERSRGRNNIGNQFGCQYCVIPRRYEE